MNRIVKPGVEALDKWDANESGQISCGELRAAGVPAPIDTSHPAWPVRQGRELRRVGLLGPGARPFLRLVRHTS